MKVVWESKIGDRLHRLLLGEEIFKVQSFDHEKQYVTEDGWLDHPGEAHERQAIFEALKTLEVKFDAVCEAVKRAGGGTR